MSPAQKLQMVYQYGRYQCEAKLMCLEQHEQLETDFMKICKSMNYWLDYDKYPVIQSKV